MVARRPLVIDDGQLSELPPGDTLKGVDAVSLVPNPSGLYLDGTDLGNDGVALARTTELLARDLTAGSGFLGGGTLSADRRFDANYASQSEAENGTENTKLMTPLRTAEAIAAQAGAGFTYNTTNVDKTLVANERVLATSGFINLTLPSSPSQGDEVSIISASGSPNVVVSGAGSPIMGLPQDLTIDAVSSTVTLVYFDATFGWRIF